MYSRYIVTLDDISSVDIAGRYVDIASIYVDSRYKATLDI